MNESDEVLGWGNLVLGRALSINNGRVVGKMIYFAVLNSKSRNFILFKYDGEKNEPGRRKSNQH